MAARAKTSALQDASRVALLSNDRKIGLRVAPQAQVIVARHKHLRMHGAVVRVAGRAAFANRLMLKDKRPALFFMTIKTSFVNAL